MTVVSYGHDVQELMGALAGMVADGVIRSFEWWLSDDRLIHVCLNGVQGGVYVINEIEDGHGGYVFAWVFDTDAFLHESIREWMYRNEPIAGYCYN